MFFSIQGPTGAQGDAGPAFLSQCHVKLSSAQSIPTATWTKVEFDTEIYDNNNEFAAYRFTAKNAGYYYVTAQMWVVAPVALSSVEGRIILSGAGKINGGKENVQSGAVPVWRLSGLVYMAVDGYVELEMYHGRGVNLDLEGGAGEQTNMQIHRVS